MFEEPSADGKQRQDCSEPFNCCLAMIQNIYIPTNPKLFKAVNFLSYIEITNEDKIEGFPAIFPNATSNLLLSLDDKISLNGDLIKNSIYASCSSTVAFRPYAGMKFMTVQFSSFGLYNLTGIPTHELHNSLYDLETLFPASDIDRLLSQLKETFLLTQKFKLLESFIADNMKRDNIHSRLPFAIKAMKSEQELSIDELSASLCISSRALLKMFKKYVGMSPSQYRRIARFNRAAKRLLDDSDSSLTSIAYDCGYFDQSHFIKDFREFGDISPSEFLALRAHSSDFYNYNLHDTDKFASD